VSRPGWGHRHRRLDERVEEARGEAELSRLRLAEARVSVVAPLRAAAEHNEFADLIRQSLIEGHGGQK
jgi:hypothetical protein